MKLVDILLNFEKESDIYNGGLWKYSEAAILGSHDIEVIDLGFGGKLYKFVWPGGYSSAYAEVLDYRGAVAEYHLSIHSTYNDLPEEIIKKNASAWVLGGGGKYFLEDNGFYSISRFSASLDAFHKTVAAELGEIVETHSPIPKQARNEYLSYISPFTSLEVSYACGDGSLPARERLMIESLIQDNHAGMLENILRGYNPEGRVMAALGLLSMESHGEKLSIKCKDSIDKVLKEPISVRYCYGCILDRFSISEAVREFKLEALDWFPVKQ